jgi:hypothetical protein
MASGINEVKYNFNYPVIVKNSRINVSGVLSAAKLYTINGQLMQTFKGSGEFTSKTLTKGIYILQVDNARTKVLVD